MTDASASGYEATIDPTPAPPPFRIDVPLERAGTCLFSVHGELDLHEAPQLQHELAEAIERGARLVVVDLGGVSFVDSMALGVLLTAVNRLRAQGGDLRLVVPAPSIRRIFEISRLDQVFALGSTRDEALAGALGPS